MERPRARIVRTVSDQAPLRVQQRGFTRARLIEAAHEVFAERGYVAATVDDIATRAGSSRATFYLHFKGKGEVASALLTGSLELAESRYRAFDDLLVSSEPQTLRKQLRVWLAEWLEIWRANAAINQALVQAATVDAEVEEQLTGISSRLIGTLTRYFATIPEPDRQRVRDELYLLEIMTQRVFSLASGSGLEVSDTRTIDVLSDMWFFHFVETRQRLTGGLAG
jgi:AcrR family transcriptional regulator